MIWVCFVCFRSCFLLSGRFIFLLLWIWKDTNCQGSNKVTNKGENVGGVFSQTWSFWSLSQTIYFIVSHEREEWHWWDEHKDSMIWWHLIWLHGRLYWHQKSLCWIKWITSLNGKYFSCLSDITKIEFLHYTYS